MHFNKMFEIYYFYKNRSEIGISFSKRGIHLVIKQKTAISEPLSPFLH